MHDHVNFMKKNYISIKSFAYNSVVLVGKQSFPFQDYIDLARFHSIFVVLIYLLTFTC